MTTDRLVAGSVAKNPQDVKPSTDASIVELHTDIEAAEPFEESTGPMPKIRIQVEPVVAEVSKPTLPPIPDQYIVQHFKQSGDFSYWWTSILVHETLEAAQEFAQGKVAARIVKIPGGAA